MLIGGNKESFDALSFGARLAGERERLGLSQQDAAAAVGVRREMWGKYERGLAEPGAGVVAAIATLGADVLYLLTGRHEVVLREGDGLVSPDLLARMAGLLAAQFRRQGVQASLYALEGEPPSATSQRFLARLVYLSAELYNELQRSGADYWDRSELAATLAAGAALAERTALTERRAAGGAGAGS